MMKNNSLFLTMAAAALMTSFAACSNDLNDAVDSASTIRFTSTLLDGASTRTTSTTLQENQLAEGVQVGLFATAVSADNVKLTANGSGDLNYEAGASLNWPASGNVDFYAYAPYAEDNSEKGTGSISFEVKADQSSDDNYLASDLLYAVKKNQSSSSSAVVLPFKHVLSKVIIKLKATTTEGQAKIQKGSTVSLTNVATKGTLTMSDGTFAAGSTKGEVTAATFASSTSATEFSSAAVIAPQTIAKDSKFIKIVIGETTYTCSLSADKTLASGSVYTFNVSFDGKAVALTSTSTLTAWTTGDETNLQPTESIEYGIGDYLLADGNFVKKESVSSATESVIGVIFSKTVSSTDQANYDAYILYIGNTNLSTAKPQGTGTTALTFASSYTMPKNLKEAAEELDGLSHTNYVKSLVSSSLSDEYPLYDLSALSSEKPSSGTFSDWFIPSIGQAIQILQNLGGATIPQNESYHYYSVMPNLSYSGESIVMSGKTYVYGSTPSSETLLDNLKKATNGTSIIVSGGRYALSSLLEGTSSAKETALMDISTNFLSSTTTSIKDDDQNHTFTDTEKKNVWGISSGSSTNNARNRIACIAAKINQ